MPTMIKFYKSPVTDMLFDQRICEYLDAYFGPDYSFTAVLKGTLIPIEVDAETAKKIVEHWDNVTQF